MLEICKRKKIFHWEKIHRKQKIKLKTRRYHNLHYYPKSKLLKLLHKILLQNENKGVTKFPDYEYMQMKATFQRILGTVVLQCKNDTILWMYSYIRINSQFWLTWYFITTFISCMADKLYRDVFYLITVSK